MSRPKTTIAATATTAAITTTTAAATAIAATATAGNAEIGGDHKSTNIIEFAGECSCFQQPSEKNLGFSLFLAIGAAEMGPSFSLETCKSAKIVEVAA